MGEVISTNIAGTTRSPHRAKKKSSALNDLRSDTKINLKWIGNLKRKANTIKLLKENRITTTILYMYIILKFSGYFYIVWFLKHHVSL